MIQFLLADWHISRITLQPLIW